MSNSLAEQLQPFSIIPASEPMVRIGAGSLALAHLFADEPPRVRERFHLTIDTPEEINQRLKGLFDINFPPMAVAHVYHQVDSVPTESDYVLSVNDLFVDTVVFNLKDRLPVEPVYQTVFGHGTHVRRATYLLISQNSHVHYCKCGGPQDMADLNAMFKDFGHVAPIDLAPVIEDYNKVKVTDEEMANLDEIEKRQKKYLNWMIANALIANLSFTNISLKS